MEKEPKRIIHNMPLTYLIEESTINDTIYCYRYINKNTCNFIFLFQRANHYYICSHLSVDFSYKESLEPDRVSHDFISMSDEILNRAIILLDMKNIKIKEILTIDTTVSL